ncbi:plasma membrane calcium [Dispira simplex]|nr:plasma membrane calcium [Dispira simplex]
MGTALNVDNTPRSTTVDMLSAPSDDVEVNPRFGVLPDEIYTAIENKDVDWLKKQGGTQGLIQQLDTHADYGLIAKGAFPEVSRRQQGHSSTSLHDKQYNIAPEESAALVDPNITSNASSREQVKSLIQVQFAERIAAYGCNILPDMKIKSLWQLIWEGLKDKMIILLCVAAIVSLGLGIYEDVRHKDSNEPKVNWVEGFAIMVAISIVIFSGALNDYRKEIQFRKLNSKKEDRQVKVIRNGGIELISVYAVQVGDILELEPGDILCADAVLIRGTTQMKCDESSVTGESDPIRKHAVVAKTQADGSDSVQFDVIEGSDPFLISGSKVLEGMGRCVVVGVGPNSFYGHTLMSLRTTNEDTPLQAKLNRMAGYIAKLGMAAAGVMLVALLIRYFVSFARDTTSHDATAVVSAIVQIVITTVTIVVVAVPEGLPLAVTLALAYATTRMIHDNCLVRVLASCETMGNATTICSDKTGTLTQNRMSVVAGTLGDKYRFALLNTRSDLGLDQIGKKSELRPSSSRRSQGSKSRSMRSSFRHVQAWVNQQSKTEPSFPEDEEKSDQVPEVKIIITEPDQEQTDSAPPASPGLSLPVPQGYTLADNSNVEASQPQDQPQENHQLLRASSPSPSASHSVRSENDGLLALGSSNSSCLSVGTSSDVFDLGLVASRVPGRVMALVHEAIVLNSTATELTTETDGPTKSSAEQSQPEPKNGMVSRLWNRVRRAFHRSDPTLPYGTLAQSGSNDDTTPKGTDAFTGSKTEAALMQWSKDSGAPELESIRNSVEIVQVWPFSSANKRMSTLVKYVRKDPDTGDSRTFWRLYVKGAPEIIVQDCSLMLHGSYQAAPYSPMSVGSPSELSTVPPSPTASVSRTPQTRADSPSAPLLTLPDGSLGTPVTGTDRPSPLTLAIPSGAGPADISPTISLLPPSPGAHLGKGADDLLNVESAYYLQAPGTPLGSRVASPSPSASEQSFVFPASSPGITVVPLGTDQLDEVNHAILEYSNRSLRTIGLAYREFDAYDAALFEADHDDELVKDLTWLGVFGIEDPLRPGVVESVEMCKNAGVMVRMVTGDNVHTARAIATQCGIYRPDQGGLIMEGPHFRALSDEEKNAVIPRLQVLARSSPDDKKSLVEWLRNAKQVVAVTGDGTNDGPALKAADIGFSMGIAGTEVAKEASSIILMDDNFASIVKAMMWGRCVNDAVRKFLQFQLTVNVTAVLLAFITAVSDSNQASVLTAVQLLWVNLIMDTLAALALATDPPNVELLQRPPDKRNGPLITLSMWKMILGQAMLQTVVCLVLYYKGGSIFGLDTNDEYENMQLRTLVFNTFVFLQIFNEVNARELSNKMNVFHRITKNNFFMGIFVLIVVLQVIIVEFGGVAFKTESQNWKLWLTAVILGLLALPMAVIIKSIHNNWFSWLPTSITENYYHPKDLTWKSPKDIIEQEFNSHSMFKDARSVSSHDPTPVEKSPEISTTSPPTPSVTGNTLKTGRSYRRHKSSAGLSPVAMMVPALTMSAVGIHNSVKGTQPRLVDGVFIPMPRSPTPEDPPVMDFKK